MSTLLHSSGFRVAAYSALLLAAVFWLGFAYWTHRDAQRRIADTVLKGTASLLGLVPLVGPLVYLLFRPPETLEDAHARHMEVLALEARLLRTHPRCPVCRTEVEQAYLVCPVCTTQLKQPCVRCKAPLEPLWQACPYCATPIGAVIEPVPADLDVALTAEATHAGNGKAPPRRKRRAGAAPPAA